MEAKMVESYERLAEAAIHTELKTYYKCQQDDIEDRLNQSVEFALAVLSEPIQNKDQLVNTSVSPFFRYFKIADKAFLFIEIKFLSLGRNIVLGTYYSPDSSTAFIKAAISLRSFRINDSSSMVDSSIQIPVTNPEVLEKLLNDINDLNDIPVLTDSNEMSCKPSHISDTTNCPKCGAEVCLGSNRLFGVVIFSTFAVGFAILGFLVILGEVKGDVGGGLVLLVLSVVSAFIAIRVRVSNSIKENKCNSCGNSILQSDLKKHAVVQTMDDYHFKSAAISAESIKNKPPRRVTKEHFHRNFADAVSPTPGNGGKKYDEFIPVWNNGDYKTAFDLLSEAIQLGLEDPDKSSAHSFLGQIYIKQCLLNKAIEEFLMCLKTRVRPPDITWETAMRLYYIYSEMDESKLAKKFLSLAEYSNSRLQVPRKHVASVETEIRELTRQKAIFCSNADSRGDSPKSNIIFDSRDDHPIPKDFSDKIKTCIKCNGSLPENKLDCPVCGCSRFIWV